MPGKAEQIVYRWLRKMNIPVSFSLVEEKLQTHPDYPSLLSIAETLKDFDITNAALQMDKEKLNEAPLPFLTHHPYKGFVIIDDLKKQVKENSHFEKNWNGVVLLVEKPQNWQHKENDKYLEKERKSKHNIIGFLLLVSIALFLYLANNFSWLGAGLLVASLAGFAIAVLIVQHELGLTNDFTEKLCRAGKNTDCDAVLHSRQSKLTRWFNWADMGIIYFGAYIFLLVIILSNISRSGGIYILAILSITAIPFTLFSVINQWRVVKKWCTLCLLTVCILWGQYILLFPVILELLKNDLSTIISVNEVLLPAFLFVSIAATWLLLLKPILKNNAALIKTNYSLARFKNNPELFTAFLRDQPKTDTTPFENDLQLGNQNSSVQITIACNPYCRPCATTHKALHELTEMIDIGLTIRLNVKTNKEEDMRTIAGKYILKVVKRGNNVYKRTVLYDWFEWMDLEKFRKKYSLQEEVNVQKELEQHEKWVEQAKIEFTPTIFINGYQFPNEYKVHDLVNILKRN